MNMFVAESILFVAVFFSISTDGCLRACNTRAVDEIEVVSQGPRHLNDKEIEAFKPLFLSKLGLTKPPSREEIANHTLNGLEVVYNRDKTKHSGIPRRERRSTKKQLISFVGKASTRHQTVPDNAFEYMDILFDNFTLSASPKAKILSAKLQLFFNQEDDQDLATSMSRERGSVYMYRVVDDHGSSELLDSRSVPLGVPIWRTFDVTDAVKIWNQEEAEFSRKQIQIKLDSSQLYRALQASSDQILLRTSQRDAHSELLPLQNHLRLDVTFLAEEKQISQRRSRRSQAQYHSSGTDCISGETTCCREQRTVSFADLGWDYWVVSPASFTLYHCKGSCPQGHRMANNYATIKSQLHVLNPSEWDAPCCTASSLSDLTVHHVTPTGYEQAIMEDIIVEECMCV